MPDQGLLDQLIAQQSARQGHPLAAVPANTPPPPATPVDPKLTGLLDQLFGPGPSAERMQGEQYLKQGQLPSDAVGKVYGMQGDIELPPASGSGGALGALKGLTNPPR